MERALVVLLLLILIPTIYATCEEGQIDINSASIEDLIKIDNIAEKRAQQIIELRPFESVDDLIRVVGIGEIYLSEIKEQDLACVDKSEEKEEDNTEDEPEEKEEDEKYIIEEDRENKEDKKEEILEIRLEKEKTGEVVTHSETIILATKDIKSENNFFDKTKYAQYGLIIFCLLISVLVILKFLKKQNGFE
jgi:hypothetical protein